MLHHTVTEEERLRLQLDVVMTRNAHLIVALRHAIALAHVHADGHQRARRWPQCPHKDCSRAAYLLGEAR
jgi:hypothetical protein